jgi:hypothetical protein
MIAVGSKVRATLGSTVIEGEVTTLSENLGDGYEITVQDKPLVVVDLWNADGWHFEELTPLPTLVGAVVRNDADGSLYVRQPVAPGVYEPYPWREIIEDGEIWGDNTVAEGGFTVLFGGVEA